MENILEVKNLTKQYRGTKALANLSLSVPKGAVYGLVGKNGAGKTTLFRLLCGLQAPTAGSFSLYGVENTDRRILHTRRRMAAVVESPSIYSDMTAMNNLTIQAKMLGLPSFESLPSILELVNLSDTGKKRAGKFSLGMRQRLGIAMALVGNPDFLVLDEPVNGLDPEGIIEIRELILRLNRERGITVLLSSHILDELSRLATHYGFIDKGSTVREISAENLMSACRKCLSIAVSDTAAAACALDALALPYEVTDSKTIEVFGEIDLMRLTDALRDAGCTLSGMTQRDESLEGYYMNLLGGDRHA